MVKIKREGLNIMHNVKLIDELKAELVCIIGELFKILTKGSNVAHDAIIECISQAIIILYILADRLGYSYAAVDETMKQKLNIGIEEQDEVEAEGRNLSRLEFHIKQRQ